MTRARLSIVLLASLVALFGIEPTPAAATPPAPAMAVPARVTEGTLLWRTSADATPEPAPLVETDVTITVTGPVARAAVRQAFTNPSSEWAEGIYVFPLPEDAAVDHLRMHVGDRVIEGMIRERAAARATYERARQDGTRATLVEQERPNVFTTSLANIPPAASIVVEIEYQHVVRYDDGRYHLRFPMVVAPRYMPGAPLSTPPTGTGWSPDTDAVPDASRISPPVRHPSQGPINPVRLTVDIDAGVPVRDVVSPYHAIHTAATGNTRYEVTLADGPVPADRDFELVWRAGTTTPAAALFTESTGGDVFALLTVVPAVPDADATTEHLARELIFVIDTSGSMAGTSIEQARSALALALGRLQPADTFNVIQFNHRTDVLFPGARPADAANVQLAQRWVGALRANGGTEMLPALLAALDGQEHPGRVRQVIFLTDGAVGNEERLFAAIRERLGDSRLFTIGIGSAPNRHFMREAARHGRGTFTSIGSVTEVHAKMDALFRKIESPVLTDLRLELGGPAVEMFPDRLPDLYAGEPVVVALKTSSPPSHAVLHGRLGDAEWRQDIVIRTAAEHSGIAVQWARAKIAALLDTPGTGADADATRTAVIGVALRHHLVTRHTSLVAVDVTPARPGDATLRTHALETNLPAGWQYEAVFGLGQGATAATLHLVAGAIALLFAAAFYVVLRYERVPAALGRRDA